MAATPQNGLLMFRGTKTSQLYTISGYFNDVANGSVTLNPQGKAGTSSLQYWRCPMNEDVILEDFAMTTGTADTTNIVLTQDGAVLPGTVMAYVPFLSTLNNRPRIAKRFPAGSLIGAIQNA